MGQKTKAFVFLPQVHNPSKKLGQLGASSGRLGNFLTNNLPLPVHSDQLWATCIDISGEDKWNSSLSK